MSNELLGGILLASLIGTILIGFPISFTLLLLAVLFGWIGLGTKVFYLMVFQIPTDTIQCGGVAKQRCKALRRLVVSQEIDSEGDYIKKIKKEMKKILPKRPPKVKRYHNGVIHGNF